VDVTASVLQGVRENLSDPWSTWSPSQPRSTSRLRENSHQPEHRTQRVAPLQQPSNLRDSRGPSTALGAVEAQRSSLQPRGQSFCVLHRSQVARVSSFFIAATQPEPTAKPLLFRPQRNIRVVDTTWVTPM
jgi:hypothetical protein